MAGRYVRKPYSFINLKKRHDETEKNHDTVYLDIQMVKQGEQR